MVAEYKESLISILDQVSPPVWLHIYLFKINVFILEIHVYMYNTIAYIYSYGVHQQISEGSITHQLWVLAQIGQLSDI